MEAFHASDVVVRTQLLQRNKQNQSNKATHLLKYTHTKHYSDYIRSEYIPENWIHSINNTAEKEKEIKNPSNHWRTLQDEHTKNKRLLNYGLGEQQK